MRSQHQKLQEELARMAREEAERDGGGGGIGQGMSELNPALSEELARLRRHNEQLAAKVFRVAVFWLCVGLYGFM